MKYFLVSVLYAAVVGRVLSDGGKLLGGDFPTSSDSIVEEENKVSVSKTIGCNQDKLQRANMRFAGCGCKPG